MENDFVESTANKLYGEMKRLMDSESSIDKLVSREEFDKLWNGLDCESRKAVGKQMERMSKEHKEKTLPEIEFYYDNNGSVGSMNFRKELPRSLMQKIYGFTSYEREYFKNPFEGCKK